MSTSLAAQLQVLSRTGGSTPPAHIHGSGGVSGLSYLAARHDKTDIASILSEEGQDTSMDLQTIHAGAVNSLERLGQATSDPEFWRLERESQLFQVTAGESGSLLPSLVILHSFLISNWPVVVWCRRRCDPCLQSRWSTEI